MFSFERFISHIFRKKIKKHKTQKIDSEIHSLWIELNKEQKKFEHGQPAIDPFRPEEKVES